MKQYLDQKKLRTKLRTSANGHAFGGKPYSRGGLYKLLNNEVYIGRIAHRGESYSGEHQAILEPETWEKVKAMLAANNQGHRQPGTRKVAPSILAGLVFDAEGNRYTPTHAVKKGRRYRYYTSQGVIQKRKKPTYLGRIPARELEQVVFVPNPEAAGVAAGTRRLLPGVERAGERPRSGYRSCAGDGGEMVGADVAAVGRARARGGKENCAAGGGVGD